MILQLKSVARIVLFILPIIFFTTPVYASCGSVHLVTLWEVSRTSDLFFKSQPNVISKPYINPVDGSGHPKDTIKEFTVMEVFKGDLRPGQTVRAIFPYTGDVPGEWVGSFSTVRGDGLVSLRYLRESNRGSDLIANNKIPGCEREIFNTLDIQKYFIDRNVRTIAGSFWDYLFRDYRPVYLFRMIIELLVWSVACIFFLFIWIMIIKDIERHIRSVR